MGIRVGRPGRAWCVCRSARETETRQRVSRSSRVERPRHVMMSVGHTDTSLKYECRTHMEQF